jgi:hypothetical protein
MSSQPLEDSGENESRLVSVLLTGGFFFKQAVLKW